MPQSVCVTILQWPSTRFCWAFLPASSIFNLPSFSSSSPLSAYYSSTSPLCVCVCVYRVNTFDAYMLRNVDVLSWPALIFAEASRIASWDSAFSQLDWNPACSVSCVLVSWEASTELYCGFTKYLCTTSQHRGFHLWVTGYMILYKWKNEWIDYVA